MSGSLRVKMSLETFNALPRKVLPRTMLMEDPEGKSDRAMEWLVAEFADRFIFKNEAIHRSLFEPESRRNATPGQRILYALSALDGQVKNGGIEQFFWNCPNLIFDVCDALDALNVAELRDAYDRAVEALAGKKENWHELREKAYGATGELDWEPFRQSYELLNIDWFNEGFYDKYDPKDYSKVIQPGWSSIMCRHLVEYVRSHIDEFIET